MPDVPILRAATTQGTDDLMLLRPTLRVLVLGAVPLEGAALRRVAIARVATA